MKGNKNNVNKLRYSMNKLFLFCTWLPRSEEERKQMKSHTTRIKQHLGYKHDSLIDISPESIVIKLVI